MSALSQVGFGRADVQHRDAPVVCAHCGRDFSRQRPWQVFCSPTCRQAAFREQKANGELVTHGTGAGSSASKITAVRPSSIQEVPVKPHFQNASQRGVRAPRHVIEAELAGSRTWRTVVSSDGVVTHVSVLRRRALQNGSGR
jgi:hypothetical protein